MATPVTFTVAAIYTRTVPTKRGPATAFDLVATDGTKYQFAFTNPNTKGIMVGSTVSGYAESGKYGMSLDPKTASLGSAPSGPAPTPTSEPSAAPRPDTAATRGERVFPVPVTSGGTAIIRQNALSNAVSVVADFVATRPAEEWPDREAWVNMVIETAYAFAEFSSGQREVKAAKRLASAGMGTGETAAVTSE